MLVYSTETYHMIYRKPMSILNAFQEYEPRHHLLHNKHSVDKIKTASIRDIVLHCLCTLIPYVSWYIVYVQCNIRMRVYVILPLHQHVLYFL